MLERRQHAKMLDVEFELRGRGSQSSIDVIRLLRELIIGKRAGGVRRLRDRIEKTGPLVRPGASVP